MIVPTLLWNRLATPTVKRSLWLVAGLGFVVNLLLLTSPIYMLQLYDRVLTSRSMETLLALSVIALFLLLGYGLLEVMRAKVMIDMSTQLDNSLNETLFDSLFRESVLHHSPGGQPIRDLEIVRSMVSGRTLLTLFDLPWTPLFIALIFVMHPLLGTVALLGAIVTVVLAIFSERLSRPLVKEASQQQIKAAHFVESCLRNVNAIHAMGMTPNIRKRWLVNYLKSVDTGAHTAERVSSFAGTSKAMRIILQSTILGCGAFLVLEGEVSPGVMIAASIIFGRAIGPLEQSIAASKGLLTARLAMQRIDTLLGRHVNHAPPMPLPAPTGTLQVEALALVPPKSNKPILQGVSFSLMQGEVLAIVGPSASGKSSLARALVGLWQPAGGKIRLDGADLSQWDPVLLGQYVGFLPQDVELLVGTVKENIARFNEVDADAVVEAASRSACHSMILKLSEGYETQIGEGGSSLSAGQCQRIALARCFYGNPVLLVLDEPDANLDMEGKIALDRAIADMKARKVTVILITHNTKLLQHHADKAMLLANGKMLSLGTPQELAEKLSRRNR